VAEGARKFRTALVSNHHDGGLIALFPVRSIVEQLGPAEKLSKPYGWWPAGRTAYGGQAKRSARFDDRGCGYAAAMLKHTAVIAGLLAAPVAMLSACSSNGPSNQPSSSATSSPPPGTERLTTELKTADGTSVANATLEFANGYATVTVETVAGGILTPGFHGLHIHSVGKCEASSVAPTGGEPGDFNSAGGHFQAPGHTGHPSSGDLTSLEVRSDGSARLVTTTDAFAAADLRGGEGSALIIHQDPDNFGNIPPRYTHNGVPGPDEATLATGDSGPRVACGVIAPASTTSTSTSTVTTTVIPTTGAPATTQPSLAPGTTSTVTVTVPTITTTIPAPGNPVPPGNPPAPGGG
jgi:Cu-Zn family superoxide dismutase